MKSAWKVLVVCVLMLTVTAVTPMEVRAQASYYLEYVGSGFAPSGTASDVWGWTAPDGTEYAIMGYTAGLAFFRTTPIVQLVDTKPGPVGSGGSIWRDIKTYGDYAYSVSEATGAYSGISVYDLTYLPDSAKYIGSFSTDGGSQYTSHNINIDEATGYAYVEGSGSQNQKVRILDLGNPENPVFVSQFLTTGGGSIHDIYAHNDTLYVAEGNAGTWSIWDMSNKLSPQMIVRISVPAAGYVHNIWPSEDHQYVVTTEETDFKTVKIWDVSDYLNVSLSSEYLSVNFMCHNAHWKGDFHINSHYEAGLQLVDVSDPANPVEWDRVDTYPANNGNSYNGCWGAFPFTQNGYIYASNINDGKLWVFNLASTCPPAGVPAPLDPAEAAEGVNQPYLFTWADEGADSYDFQVDEDVSFATPDIDANTATPQYQVDGLPLEASCYWRVRSNNSCGSSAWSAPSAFTTGCVIAVTGDVNVDGVRTSADIVEIVNYVFNSGSAPLPTEEAGDVDCSGSVSSEDIIVMVNFTFKAGPEYCNACSLL